MKQKKHHELSILLLSALLLTGLVIFTYRNVFDNGFVDWDDFTYVVNNDLVRDTEKTSVADIFRTPVSSNYHPLTILSMRMNGNECPDCPEGISPKPFISWNIVLHLLNTILVLALARQLSRGNLFVSVFTAAIFAIHPMHVESVAWISERKDVLYAFFFLGGLIAYIRNIQTGKAGWLATALILFVLSCLSKAVAVVFPLVMILIDYWFGEEYRGRLKERALRLAPFLLISLFFGLMAYRIQDGRNFLGLLDMAGTAPDVVGSAGPFTLWEKFRNGGYAFMAYLIKFVAPLKLVAFYPYPGSAEYSSSFSSLLLSAAPFGMLLVIAAVIWSARKTKLILFGSGFFLVTIILVLQFLPVGYAIIADRYSYIPYIGLAFIAGTLISSLPRLKIPLYIISAGLVLLLASRSSSQVETWKNTLTLWDNTLEVFPRAEVALRSRGKLYSKQALREKGEERMKLEQLALNDLMAAAKSGSRNAEVYEGIGVILGSGKETEKALRYFDAALKLDRSNGSVYYNRALALAGAGRNDEAIDNYSRALELSPEKAVMIRTNRSNLLLSMRRYSEAIPDLDFLIEANPGSFNLFYNRAVSRLFTGNVEGAIADYRRALRINPRDEQAARELAEILRMN